MAACECDWRWHRGEPCPVPAAELGDGVRSSPELCTQCLYVCEGEREDELEDTG